MNEHLYIRQHYLTLAELARRTQQNEATILAWIKGGCLPKASYEITTRSTVRSFFGTHEGEPVTTAYFGKGHVALIESLKGRAPTPLEDLATTLKEEFFSRYHSRLLNLEASRWGLGHLFNAQNIPHEPALQTHLKGEWSAYLDGTYGLCTRTALPEDIATKEVMVSKIKHITGDMSKTTLSPDERVELMNAVTLLDEVSALFAPHERAMSSRTRYIDQVKAQYLAEQVETQTEA